MIQTRKPQRTSQGAGWAVREVGSEGRRKAEKSRRATGPAGGGKGGWAAAGLGLAGVLREPAGAEAVYLVSH